MYVAAADHIADAVEAVAVLLALRLGASLAHGLEVGDAPVRRRTGKVVEQLVIRKRSASTTTWSNNLRDNVPVCMFRKVASILLSALSALTSS